MNKWLRRGAFTVAGAVAALAAALVLGAQLGERKMQRQVALPADPGALAVSLPGDAAGLARGRYLYLSRGCTECHAVDGAGKDVVNDGKGMRVRAPNITPAPGSAVERYTVADWVRTVRHGVKPDGRPAIVMPSEDYNRLTDADLGALIAWLRQMPAAQGGPAVIEFPLPVKALYAAGVIHDAAEIIDHALPPPQPVPEAATALHGGYVANACIGCHGAGLSGGRIPGAPPEWPAAANLTPGAGSAMAHYADADAFIRMLRTGRRPDGSAVDRVMPFESLQALNDTDAQALYLHLKGLAPRAAGHR
jgi:mono/diheme cytochrome c family protein